MNKGKFILGGAAALLGLLIMIFPAFWVKVVVILLGIGSIVYGVYNYKVTKAVIDDSSYERTLLIKSIVSVVVGILAVVLPLTVANTMWTIMVYILAVYLLVAAALGFYSVSLLKDSGIDRKKFIFENLGLLIGAIVLFFIPTKNLGAFIVRLIGFVLIVLGAVIITIEVLSSKKTANADLEVKTEETGSEPEIKEETAPEAEKSDSN